MLRRVCDRCAGDSGQTKNCFISPDDDDGDDDSTWPVRIGHGQFNGVSQVSVLPGLCAFVSVQHMLRK
jgi:hypothetical protein